MFGELKVEWHAFTNCGVRHVQGIRAEELSRDQIYYALGVESNSSFTTFQVVGQMTYVALHCTCCFSILNLQLSTKYEYVLTLWWTSCTTCIHQHTSLVDSLIIFLFSQNLITYRLTNAQCTETVKRPSKKWSFGL